MSTGWMAWAALMLATGAPGGADDVVHINQQKFQIPIRVLPERQGEVRELMLYLSRDRGQSWEIYARATPDRKAFDFFSDRDGMFYFSIAVVDRRGQQDPRDIYRAPVGQKIYIDTVKPVVKLTAAERQGDDVRVGWTIREDRPERESLRLEYRVGDSPTGQWTPLPILFGDNGTHTFKPGLAGPVKVRLSLRDLAGNEAVDERLVPAKPVHHDHALSLTSGEAQPSLNGGGNPPPPPPVHQDPPPARTENTAPLATTTQPPAATPPPAAHQPAHGSMPTRGSLPTLQIVNKRQVKLGFDVTRFGPSGLGSVDVYITSDEGATWELSKGDSTNVTLPVTAEVKGSQPVRGSVTVNLPRDAQVFGFYMVVKNRAGLGKAPPQPGTPPHVRLELDTIQPEAELYAPQADGVRSDSLALTWKASDRNLADNPVSLEWSARPDGPWTFIGTPQLANTGRYLWQVPDNTPPKVYLRLSVRDTAGNTAVAQTQQPVVIDVTPPELGNVTVQTGAGR